MVRQRFSPVTLIQYGLIGLFALQGLQGQPLFSPAWWVTLGLVLALSGLVLFWPVRRGYTYAYLAAEMIITFSLTWIDVDFMFLAMLLGPPAFLLLPIRAAVFVIGAFSLAMEVLVGVRSDLSNVLYPGLAEVIGTFSFGYVYYLRDQAEIAREQTQALLDELREAHQKLEAYAAQVQELTAAEERNRLARELHDSVKQQAFAASAQLGAARSLLDQNPPAARDHLLKAESLLDEVRRELSQLIYELRPSALQNQGLAGALRAWGAGWSQQAAIPLEVRVQGERALAQETEQALFRIAQEALSNIARHSQAQAAEIRLEYGPQRVTLAICDDGRGFDPAQPGDGIGLKSMRERVERLPEGSIEVTTAPQKGTRVTVECVG